MQILYKKSLKAADLPPEWREAVDLQPNDEVTVVITPARGGKSTSPKHFIGAGRGLFRSACEVDAYLRRRRDAWES
jgi:hypothetical protein